MVDLRSLSILIAAGAIAAESRQAPPGRVDQVAWLAVLG